jgi:hypothetical protein
MKNKRGSLYRNDFLVADGMAVQEGNMTRWKKVLNAVSYELLANRVAKENAKLATIEDVDGYDVYRGSILDNFVHNLYLND